MAFSRKGDHLMEQLMKVYRVDRQGERLPGPEEIEEITRISARLISVNCDNDEEIIAKAADADAIITTDARITRRVLAKLPNLQVVVRYGIGYDTIDVEAATENHVLVVNIPDYSFDEVSNHALALLLACSRKLVITNDLAKANQWTYANTILAPMGPITGQVLGLVGCGNIARMVAKKAQAFGLIIVGYDPYLDLQIASNAGIRLVTFAELLSISDYVSVHTPLTAETRHLVGEKEFRMMKSTAYIINTSRGPVVDESALIKALQEKSIAGAGIDVLEKEPPNPDNPLLKMENVIVTPHTAYYSDQSAVRLRRSVGSEAARVLSGKWPKNLVNKGVQPKKPLV
jgi:D-3-phosphoglycerate dehydrogenase / 2-oxoglutarate reductase